MNKIIAETVRLHCPIDQAFSMFTTNTALESWLAIIADIEPIVGGRYELFWDPEHREHNSTLGCKVTAIVPSKLLAFEWKGPTQFAHFMNTADPLTHVAVFFTPCDEVLTPCTDVYLIHSGWGSSEEWKAARQFFVRAWEKAFEALETLVNG